MDLVPPLSALHFEGSIPTRQGCRPLAGWLYWPLSDVPERHLGFPIGPIGLKGRSIIDRHWLIHPLSLQLCGITAVVNDWIAIHEATWPTWNPLLMRLDTGVPDLHCGIAARAIPRAMVDLRSIIWLFLLDELMLLLLREENR